MASGSSRTTMSGAPLVEGRYTKTQLGELYRMAEDYKSEFLQMRDCSYFYRDQTKSYFKTIFGEGGLMQGHTKDLNGDPKSPANGNIKGLFFSVNVDKDTEEVPNESIYGPRRLLIPVPTILALCPNLYFTDFYCMFESHYVTLVLTKPGTPADQFCKQHLLGIDIEENPFFQATFMDAPRTMISEVLVSDQIWVEILVTEDIDITHEGATGATWHNVHMKGGRTGGSKGIPKNKKCDICNLSWKKY